MDPVEKIAATVLYEGYVLWPYRRSAVKNQRRWTFGGVYPRAYSEAEGGNDPWLMRTQCLVLGEAPTVEVKVRFLHVVERKVGRRNADGSLEFVDELRVGEELHLAWQEAAEREVVISGLTLPELEIPMRAGIDLPAGSREGKITDPEGRPAGALVRSWQCLQGAVEVKAEPVRDGLFRLTVEITNTAPWDGQDRESTLHHTFVSTHTILKAQSGEFVSLTDPPEDLEEAATACENLKTWPVLAGEEGSKHTVLSSPIILYDYPQVAPESPGDLFDGGEVDQLLTLSILGLTDEEREEARATDPRTREILERTESLTEEQLMDLHGRIQGPRMQGSQEQTDPFEAEGLSGPGPLSVIVDGVEVGVGSRVRLKPRARQDIFDIALAGKMAVVEKVEQDYEDHIFLAVTVEEDPGREMAELPVLGHRFFFSPDEIEVLGS